MKKYIKKIKTRLCLNLGLRCICILNYDAYTSFNTNSKKKKKLYRFNLSNI